MWAERMVVVDVHAELESTNQFLFRRCTLVLTYFTPDLLDWIDEAN